MQVAKTVVLSCAGIGSRLGLDQTKALIDINGRSLISWQLELLKHVDDLRVVVGYRAKEVINEVLKFRKDAIFVFNHNYFDTKTGASFYLGSKFANEYVVEWDGDLVVHPKDVEKCLNFDGEYVGYSEISSEDGVYVTLSDTGDVLSFSRTHGSHEWTGPACIRRDKICFTKNNVYNQIKPHLPIKGLKIRARDIDTYEDYLSVLEFISDW